MRSILAVSSGDPRVVDLALELADRHDAELTLIESWRLPRWARMLCSSAYATPFSPKCLADDAEDEAVARGRAVLCAAPRGIVVRCKRGAAPVVAASEVRNACYDVVIVEAGWLARSVLAPLVRRRGIELVRP